MNSISQHIVWGVDYATADGTGVRDYIYGLDLALGYPKTLESLDQPRSFAVNLAAMCRDCRLWQSKNPQGYA